MTHDVCLSAVQQAPTLARVTSPAVIKCYMHSVFEGLAYEDDCVILVRELLLYTACTHTSAPPPLFARAVLQGRIVKDQMWPLSVAVFSQGQVS